MHAVCVCPELVDGPDDCEAGVPHDPGALFGGVDQSNWLAGADQPGADRPAHSDGAPD